MISTVHLPKVEDRLIRLDPHFDVQVGQGAQLGLLAHWLTNCSTNPDLRKCDAVSKGSV